MGIVQNPRKTCIRHNAVSENRRGCSGGHQTERSATKRRVFHDHQKRASCKTLGKYVFCQSAVFEKIIGAHQAEELSKT